MKVMLVVLIIFLNITLNAQQISGAYKDSTVIKFFQRTHGWVASDGALSVPLEDGSVLWLMGDSHIDDLDTVTNTLPCLFQVRNAALHQPPNDWDWHNTKTMVGHGEKHTNSLFKNKEDNKFFSWPGMGIQLKDTIYVYSNSLQKTGPGMWGFGPAGFDYWAKIKYPEMEVVQYSDIQNFNNINFGCGFVRQDEFVYAFGQKGDNKGVFINTHLYVARFPADAPNAPWQFWNGSNWVNDVNEIKSVMEAPLVAFQVDKVRNQFVVVATELSVACNMGKRVFTIAAENMTGPYAKPKEVFTIDDTLQGHIPFFYTPAIHPEYINEKNELLITYCINGYHDCLPDCDNGRSYPDHYRPKAIRVPVDYILKN